MPANTWRGISVPVNVWKGHLCAHEHLDDCLAVRMAAECILSALVTFLVTNYVLLIDLLASSNLCDCELHFELPYV